jgi:hypothetical protein
MMKVMPGPITVTPAQAEDPAQEIQQTQQEVLKVYTDTTKSLTGINPFTGIVGGSNPSAQQNGQAGNSANPGQIQFGGANIEALQKLADQPGVRKTVQVVQNPEFLQDLAAFATHPKRNELGYAELAWVLAILMLRSWRLAKTSNWFVHFWISFSNFVLFWVGAVGLLPYIVIGPAYTKLITDAIRLYKSAN